MGVSASKCYRKRNERSIQLRNKIQILEEEIKEMRKARERETQSYERHVTTFTCKEEQWRLEKKKQRDENQRLLLRLKEEENRAKKLENCPINVRGLKEWQEFGTSYIVEQMKQEQMRREEAVEKWKQLYLTIKTELDDLIQRTNHTNGEERYCREREQGTIERLQIELNSKQETIESLKEKIQKFEKDSMRKDQEIDILRQSLRILSLGKRNRAKKALNTRDIVSEKNPKP